MSVIAMEVVEKKNHPNADALKIYQFQAPGFDTIQVIANLENEYEPGDVVAVAQIGAHLKDGLKIKKTRLRGVESYGMAMGTVDHEPGTDLTTEHCLPPEPVKVDAETFPVKVAKWTSIELFHNIRRSLDKEKELDGEAFTYPKVTYKSKIKLDGTNGGIHLLPDGTVIPQSRSRLLTVRDDNIQFAAWVEANNAYFSALARSLGQHTILFGEWCGKGIQKRTAISKIDRKIYAVFAVQYGDHNELDAMLDVEPARIRALLPSHPDIYVLPWLGDDLVIDYGDQAQMQTIATQLNTFVEDVEHKDPWVSEHFGVEGLGEGIVLYPFLKEMTEGPVHRGDCTGLMFKAKGEKHRVVKQKKSVQIDPEVAQSIEQFVDMFVTQARLEQGLQEACEGEADPRKTGNFLKWFGQDVKKESVAELEASNLEWKDVSKAVMNRAKKWYLTQA
ncbi:MAG TPA: hypothetical protein DCE42_30565 [Myxococcales bacterium]|nr:hypothetical protein [Deltaproteobacteria bacterium]HAA59132.1 hypothetical protein [Myxococcales bacterium]|tara:strand:- start:14620 stop:15957 length:1338 start_codon:yes stop_codon:yes gene_type:complete